jgi:hypothetical protein
VKWGEMEQLHHFSLEFCWKIMIYFNGIVTSYLIVWRAKNFKKWLLTSSCLAVCLSVLLDLHGSPSTHIRDSWYLNSFSKICRENSRFIKIWQKKRSTLREDVYVRLMIKCRSFLKMRNVSETRCGENQSIHFVSNNSPPPEIRFV